MSPLPYCRASELEEKPRELRWLVDELWGDGAVGIVGAEPKSFKTFLALHLAVAVASGAPCLRRFRVSRRGRVLLFAAEDALHVVRSRLAGIAAASGVGLDDLPIDVITVPIVRLDVPDHQRKLRETVEQVRPRLLVLDPFVRLHRVDENAAAEVAPILAFLRELQRRYETAVLLVHHARKGAAHARAGQALRGSSELHAWGDSNLYLRRKRDDSVVLTVEHRAAPSRGDLRLALREDGDSVALAVCDEATPATAEPAATEAKSATAQIEDVLRAATTPLSQREVRDACKLRTKSVCEALTALVKAGRVERRPGGRYAISASASGASLQSSGSGNGKQAVIHWELPGETESGSAGTQPDEG